jgi:hypothetical protein
MSERSGLSLLFTVLVDAPGKSSDPSSGGKPWPSLSPYLMLGGLSQLNFWSRQGLMSRVAAQCFTSLKNSVARVVGKTIRFDVVVKSIQFAGASVVVC